MPYTQNYRRIALPHNEQMVELLIRPIQPEDAPALQLHHSRLSTESVFNRFHGFKKELTKEEAQQFCCVDGKSTAAVVAVRAWPNQQEEIEGVARYYQTEPGVVEMAIVVRDSYQKHGLGKVLLEELIKIALCHDIHYMDALVLSENWHMRHLLHEFDYPLTAKYGGEAITVRMDLTGSASATKH